MAIGSIILVAAVVASLGAASASLWALDGRGQVNAARAALGVCAAFTASAAALLVGALLRADLTLAYAAQNITANLGAAGRLVSLWAGTPGSALAAAAMVAIAGAVFVTEAAALALVSIVVTALLAASISGGALSVLPWTPADGMGLSPTLQHPLAGLAVFAACASAVCATMGASSARSKVGPAPWIFTAFAALLIAAVSNATSAIRMGVTQTAGMIAGPAGVWLVAAVTVGWSALALAREGSLPRTHLIATGAAMGAVMTSALAGLGQVEPGTAIQMLALMALLAGVYAALVWRKGAAPRRLGAPSMLVLLALGVLATTAALGQRRGMVTERVASGQTVELGGAHIAHQGISRYEAPRAHVLAVALERQGRASPALARAEQREYFDARGSMVGEVVEPPAVFRGLWQTTYVWLEGVDPGDAVRLRASSVALDAGWWLAAVLSCLAAVLACARRPEPTPGVIPLFCPNCGARPEPASRWCSNCGRQLAH
jgi:cytochrome c biogenesis factor